MVMRNAHKRRSNCRPVDHDGDFFVGHQHRTKKKNIRCLTKEHRRRYDTHYRFGNPSVVYKPHPTHLLTESPCYKIDVSCVARERTCVDHDIQNLVSPSSKLMYKKVDIKKGQQTHWRRELCSDLDVCKAHGQQMVCIRPPRSQPLTT